MFVAMLVSAAAVLMFALALADARIVRDPAADAEAWALASALLGSFGARMAAAVFALAVSTSGLPVAEPQLSENAHRQIW